MFSDLELERGLKHRLWMFIVYSIAVCSIWGLESITYMVAFFSMPVQ